MFFLIGLQVKLDDDKMAVWILQRNLSGGRRRWKCLVIVETVSYGETKSLNRHLIRSLHGISFCQTFREIREGDPETAFLSGMKNRGIKILFHENAS
jgi:hypothetical protein